MMIIRNLTINKFNFMAKLFKIIIKISPLIALITHTGFDFSALVADFCF